MSIQNIGIGHVCLLTARQATHDIPKTNHCKQNAHSFVFYPKNSYAAIFVLLLVSLRTPRVSADPQLHETHGMFQSPNYPSPYPDNLNVRWEINVMAGHRVKLYFVEFDMEPGTKGCNADYVLVRFNMIDMLH